MRCLEAERRADWGRCREWCCEVTEQDLDLERDHDLYADDHLDWRQDSEHVADGEMST